MLVNCERHAGCDVVRASRSAECPLCAALRLLERAAQQLGRAAMNLGTSEECKARQDELVAFLGSQRAR